MTARVKRSAKETPRQDRVGNVGPFSPPLTVSHPGLLDDGGDAAFRQTLYLMVTSFGRLLTCREAFGRAVDLTASQFAVLIGLGYVQGTEGVTIRDLASHVQLAATHVTTEVGRMCRLGLVEKRPNLQDRRSVLVRLTAKGRERILTLAPYVRSINDLLFEGIGREDFEHLDRILTKFVANSDRAIEEIRRRDRRTV